MSETRQQRAEALGAWADRIQPEDLVEADTAALQAIADLSLQRDDLDRQLAEAVNSARRANRSWTEIGAMLGVSKQAVQRKYGQPRLEV
ncbi:hypothetical protein [Candidatus Poriferisodalis sp.]|uniref:hypothetical protein n=1 Tax=Candidatus Poriferisodalis sp. TaxID=3101277 RepID=UPI003B01BD13